MQLRGNHRAGPARRCDAALSARRRGTGDPALQRNIYLASNRSEVGERLVLPLSDDSGAILHVIGASVYRMELKLGEGRSRGNR